MNDTMKQVYKCT